MPNLRIFYAIQQVGFAQEGAGSFTPAQGVQSLGMTTNFNVEQVFEMGQISIYDNVEGLPEVEVNLEKVLDGHPLLGHLATKGASNSSLVGRSTVKTMVGVSFYPDTQTHASGAPVNTVVMSGLLLNSWDFKFPLDGNFTESISLIGQHKRWFNGGVPDALPTFSGYSSTVTNPMAANSDTPYNSPSSGVNRRQNMLFAVSGVPSLDVNGAVDDPNSTILPFGVGGIPGISSSGTNDIVGGQFKAHVQSISTNVSLNREVMNELGRRAPYNRYVQFPVQVNTEIEIVSVSGDLVSCTEAGVASNNRNTADQTIRLATKEGTRINLGKKNRLTSVATNGGDTGGGNVTLTYSYQNFNDFTVEHWNDPTVAIAPVHGGIDANVAN